MQQTNAPMCVSRCGNFANQPYNRCNQCFRNKVFLCNRCRVCPAESEKSMCKKCFMQMKNERTQHNDIADMNFCFCGVPIDREQQFCHSCVVLVADQIGDFKEFDNMTTPMCGVKTCQNPCECGNLCLEHFSELVCGNLRCHLRCGICEEPISMVGFPDDEKNELKEFDGNLLCDTCKIAIKAPEMFKSD